MTEEQVHYVTHAVREVVELSRRGRYLAPGAAAAPISPMVFGGQGSSEGNL